VFFQKSFGVNIEKDSVAIVCLKAGLRKVNLEKSAVYPLDRHASHEERMRTVRGFIDEFTAGRKMQSASLYVALPRDMVLIRYVELPASVKHNIRETLVYEMRKYTPFSADDVYFDFHVIEESKESSKIRVILACAKKGDVDGAFEPLSHTQLKGVSGIEWSSSALSNYFIEKKRQGVHDRLAVVYVGKDIAEINTVEGNKLISSHMVKSGDSEEQLYDVSQKEIQRVSDAGKPETKNTVIVCGSGGRKFFASLAGTEALNISLYEEIPGDAREPSLMLAYGLALKGLHKVPVQFNFLPSSIRKKPSNFPVITLIILSVVLLLTTGAFVGGEMFQKRMAMNAINRDIQRYRSELADIESLRATVNSLEAEVLFLDNMRKSSISTLAFLQELSTVIPSTAWLDRLYLRDHEIRLYGYAQSATELLTVLEASPMFSEVAFISPITKDKSGQDKFRISMKVSSPRGAIVQ